MTIPLLNEMLPKEWQFPILLDILKQDSFVEFNKELIQLEVQNKLRPSYNNIFKALSLTSPKDIKVVILGQDPYPKPNDAVGLSFSVDPNQPIPRSLKNIYTELLSDVNVNNLTKNGDLTKWANQGILLLNTTLTTEVSKSNAHRKKGWSEFTTAIIQILNAQASQQNPIVFILWGNDAKEKGFMLNNPSIKKIESPHPSPFSARTGFFGSKPFSQTNQFLESHMMRPIDWSL